MLVKAAPPDFLKLLSHDLRWQLLRALAGSDLRVQELVQAVNQPQNLVSYHLQQLRRQGIVRERRSISDGREIYYSLDLDQISRLYFASGAELHPALNGAAAPAEERREDLQPIRVLFLCTQNSARSQMAEGILRARGKGTIDVFSAGTDPSTVNPLAVRVMEEMDIDISHQRSKALDQFLGQKFDYIITVCDRAREACPVFPGDPVQIHWSIPDPAALQGSEDEKYQAFRETATQLNTRIGYLLLVLGRAGDAK